MTGRYAEADRRSPGLLRFGHPLLGRPDRDYACDRNRAPISLPAGQPSGRAVSGSSSSKQPQASEHGRALSHGRGRNASSPWQIPLRGWKDILWRTYERIGEDRLLAVAAGVVFYGLLALFPAVTALVSLYGLFAKASTINEHMAAVTGLPPDSAVSIVQDQVNRLAAKGDAKLGVGFVAGLAIALWSANSGMKATLDVLNVVYEGKGKRGFIKSEPCHALFHASGNRRSLARTRRCCCHADRA